MVASLADADVMIVDDEPFVRQTVTRMLQTIGVGHVSEANNGRHALFELVAVPPHGTCRT